MSYPQYFGQTDKVHNTGTIIYGGDGTHAYPVLIDSSGHILLGASTTRFGIALTDPHEVRVSKAIDASVGAYAAGDMVNDDDCCTTADPWLLTGAANAAGGYGRIIGIHLINETENQAVVYRLIFFNATPTGATDFADNTPNLHPHKSDRSKFVGEVPLPSTIARGAAIATYTDASPSTTGSLPLYYKCAAGSTTLPFVLVTDTAYTQTATDDIEFIFLLEHL